MRQRQLIDLNLEYLLRDMDLVCRASQEELVIYVQEGGVLHELFRLVISLLGVQGCNTEAIVVFLIEEEVCDCLLLTPPKDLLQEVPCRGDLSTKFFVNVQSPKIPHLRVVHVQVLLIKEEEGWLQHKES